MRYSAACPSGATRGTRENTVEVTGAVALFAVALIALWRSAIDPRIAEFGIGALLMRGMVQPSLLPRIIPWAAFLLLTIFVGAGTVSVVAVTATAAVIFLLRRRELGAWAISVGAISYSLYLLHVPIGGRIINLGTRFGAGEAFDCFLIVLALAVSMLGAWFLVRLIERPSMRASRRIAYG
jgi:peptidoglycan/LPS O-acetylase OafA/YrhL